MSEHKRHPVDKRFGFLRHSAVRTGIYVGVCISAMLVGWVYLANRVPALERFALERNVIAASLIGLLALIPVIRFVRSPARLWASTLIGWTIVTITYRVLCVYFWRLGDSYSASQIFMLGAVVYMIFATMSWLGAIIWRARASNVTHSNHPVG